MADIVANLMQIADNFIAMGVEEPLEEVSSETINRYDPVDGITYI